MREKGRMDDNRLQKETENDHDSVESSSSEEFDFIESTWEEGVETGLVIKWPGTRRNLDICTKLTEERIAPLFDGTQWAGTRVWKAAVLALEFLIQEFGGGNEGVPIVGKSLLELGCGLGVPGMLWHVLQEQSKAEDDHQEVLPPRVVLTDMPDLLQQLQANVELNFLGFYGRSIETKALDWSVQGLQQLWREEMEQQHSNQTDPVFDICLNCDCIYEPLYGRDALESLADVLAEVARISPSTSIVTSVERRKGDGLEEFLQRLERSGTVQVPVRCVLRNDDDPQHVIEIYVTKGDS